MTARWITIHQAFERAVEIEGVSELAFERLCSSLIAGSIEGRAALRETTWPNAGRQPAMFELTAEFWTRVVRLSLFHDILEIEEHEDGHMVVGAEFFTLSKWKMILSASDFEKAFADIDARPTAVAIEIAQGPRPKKASGGAPQKYDWSAAAAFTTALIVNEDPTQSAAVKGVEEWFAQRGREPSDGEVRKFVADIFNQMNSAMSGKS